VVVVLTLKMELLTIRSSSTTCPWSGHCQYTCHWFACRPWK